MKYTVIIDKDREEEAILYVHEKSALTDELEALLGHGSRELIGYRDRQAVPLSVTDVHCFTVENGRLFALTDSEKLQIKQRLYQLEACLDHRFVKINQSCIAHIQKIDRFDASIGGSLLVTFQNGYRDFVSRRQLKIVKERIGFHL